MSAGEHRVLEVWIRREAGGPLESRDSLRVDAGQGVVGDHKYGRTRHVSVVFANDWNAAASEIGRSLDPVGRRANVLVSGGDGVRHVRSRVRLGGVLLDVKGTLAPCEVMDRVANGLQAALRPNGRGGVWGRALSGGEIRRGDLLIPLGPTREEAD